MRLISAVFLLPKLLQFSLGYGYIKCKETKPCQIQSTLHYHLFSLGRQIYYLPHFRPIPIDVFYGIVLA